MNDWQTTQAIPGGAMGSVSALSIVASTRPPARYFSVNKDGSVTASVASDERLLLRWRDGLFFDARAIKHVPIRWI